MCATTERKYLICGHTSSYTERCPRELFREVHQAREQRKQHVVQRFLSRFRSIPAEYHEGALCKTTLEFHAYYEICYECRSTWRFHGITEQEAVKKYQAYREKHDYVGELTPSIGPGQPTFLEELRLLGPVKRKRASKPSRKGKEKEVRPVSPASIATHKTGDTVWPSFVTKAPKEAPANEPIPDPEDMELDEVYRNLPRDEDVPDDTFDIGERRLNFHIRGYRPRKETIDPHRDTFDIGEESLNPQIRDHLRKETIDPHPRKEMIDPHRCDFNTDSSSSSKSIDLNKPLPPLPRIGSPIPGRPFDRENPDRDLPRSKYYPRFS